MKVKERSDYGYKRSTLEGAFDSVVEEYLSKLRMGKW